MIDGALFVTGAQRSGTTLLEKLLGAQERVSMLSQPFPYLYSEAKRAFLATLGDVDARYPLGHLFRESRYDASAFARFLTQWRTTPDALCALFARMESYSGQYTRFTAEQVDAAAAGIGADDDFASVVQHLDRALATTSAARWFGSKETICEEYVPPLLERGFHCAIILRDPRDVVASLNHGRGRDHGGDFKPTLFNVRAWRKSVAITIAMQDHPGFRWCRYEDLVEHPARELERFGLGTIVPDALHDGDGAVWRGNSSHTEHDGVSTSSVAAHRTVLPAAVGAFIEATCVPELERLGYPTSLSRTNAARIIEEFREPYPIARKGMESDAATPENAAIEIERLQNA